MTLLQCGLSLKCLILFNSTRSLRIDGACISNNYILMRFESSNGLCGEVIATSEPLGNLGISLMEHSGKVFLGETFFLQNLTQSLCHAKRQEVLEEVC